MKKSAPSPDSNDVVDPIVEELQRIVAQAESLLDQLKGDSGTAAEAVRQRVSQTLHQARAKLAASAGQAEAMAESLAQRADQYVRTNPWQSVALAALLGGVLALMFTRSGRR